MVCYDRCAYLGVDKRQGCGVRSDAAAGCERCLPSFVGSVASEIIVVQKLQLLDVVGVRSGGNRQVFDGLDGMLTSQEYAATAREFVNTVVVFV